MHPFRRLTVWEKAHELAVLTFRLSSGIDARRSPGVAHLLRRYAFDIATSIAEGAGHESPTHFVHFLEVAIASARTFDCTVLLAADLEAITRSDQAKLEARSEQVLRMLESLCSTVRKRAAPRRGTIERKRSKSSIDRGATKARRADPATGTPPPAA